jgi:hypothetical protein
VIALPPFDGAVQLTEAWLSPAVAVTPVGTAGAVGPVGVTALDAADSALVPTALVAETVNVYVVPFVSPVTVVEVPGGLPLTVLVACGAEPM